MASKPAMVYQITRPVFSRAEPPGQELIELRVPEAGGVPILFTVYGHSGVYLPVFTNAETASRFCAELGVNVDVVAARPYSTFFATVPTTAVGQEIQVLLDPEFHPHTITAQFLERFPPEFGYLSIGIWKGNMSVAVDGTTFSNVATGASNYWGIWAKVDEDLNVLLKGKVTCASGYAYAGDILPMDDGSFFLSGGFSQTVTVHPAIGAPGSAVTRAPRTAGQPECFLAYFNAAGTPQWVRRFGATASSPGRAFGLLLTKSGDDGVACFIQVYGSPDETSGSYQVETQLGADSPTSLGSWSLPSQTYTYGQALCRIDTTGAIPIVKQVTQTINTSQGGFPRINFFHSGKPTTRYGKIAIGYFTQLDDGLRQTFGIGEDNERVFSFPANDSSPSGANHKLWNYFAVFDEETLEVQWVASAEHFNSGTGSSGPKGGFIYDAAILKDGSVAFCMSTQNAPDDYPITRFYGDELSEGFDLDGTAGSPPISTHILFSRTGQPLWAKGQVGGGRLSTPLSVTRTPDNKLLFMQEGGGTFDSESAPIYFDDGDVTLTFAPTEDTFNPPLDMFVKRNTAGAIIDSTFNRIVAPSGLNGSSDDYMYSYHQVAARERQIWATSTWTKDFPLLFGPDEGAETTLARDTLGPAVYLANFDASLNLLRAIRLTTISGISAGYNYLSTQKLSLGPA